MQTRSRNTFTSIHTEGSLLPVDLLQRVLAGDKDLGGLTPADYHLPGREKLNEAVNRSWNRLQGAWAAFQTSKSRLKEGDPGTTLTRERWLLPLFQELGYGRLVTLKAIEIEGKTYPISHGWANVPIHLVGCGIDLDRRAAGVAGASRSSPHSLVQELLNRADDRLWGMVANGLRLRILRDNASLTRQAFLEFDLEAMFSGDVYSDFVLLWLLSHQSRFESADGKTEAPWLEKWAKAAQERGTRALDQLRNGVEEAISALGSGFLSHHCNQELRKKLRTGELDAQDYYRQLLRLVYRLIFLFVAEDRDLLLDPGASVAAKDRYQRYYSTARLRRLAERQRGGRHADLWQGLLVVTDILAGKDKHREGAKSAKNQSENIEKNLASFASLRLALGLPVLNGFLFSEKALPDLEMGQVDNQALLSAIRSLAFTVEGRSLRAVDYKNLGAEELGSVYESLLELHPRIHSEAGMFELSSASGNERKTTGSYYTPSSLIQVLLDSALDPVIAQALKRAEEEWNRQDAKSTKSSVNQADFASLASLRLLNLKVCDPACGSGHFLIAAAHRIADQLARVRAAGDEPSVLEKRKALREVIAHCIYGVDVNPMAVELCKVNLWLESIEPGKPLSFLDAHIQCGDSLVGVGPGLNDKDLNRKDAKNAKEERAQAGLIIPDEAFKAAYGDDKATAAGLRKRNKREREGQLGFRWKVTELSSAEEVRQRHAERAGQVDAMPEDDPVQVQAKAQAYAELQQEQELLRKRLEYDLWTAAFFWHIPKGNAENILAPTQQELLTVRVGGDVDKRLVDLVREMAERLNFFHWELAFPQVFSGENAGFDCVLGNPPWERIKLQEAEFFASRDPEIAAAPNKASRQKLIDRLTQINPALAQAFTDAKHAAECSSKFVRTSQRYPLTAVGDVNTYALFAEHFRGLMSARGRAGVIVPTGIATDDTTKEFFGDLVEKRAIASLFDFENREKLFPAVDSRMKFCLLTLSGSPVANAQFVFFATRVEHLRDANRISILDSNRISIFNPKTKTLPLFRTYNDEELTRNVYGNFPIPENDVDKTWDFSQSTMFHSMNHVNLFIDQDTLKSRCFDLVGNKFISENSVFYPLYEGKIFMQYDHRFAHVEISPTAVLRPAQPKEFTSLEHESAETTPLTRAWVEEKEILNWCENKSYEKKWFLVYKKITSATNEHTLISSFIPWTACVDTIHIIIFKKPTSNLHMCAFNGNLNSIILDYITRQKVGGTAINFYVLNQLPFIPSISYTDNDFEFIVPKILELTYTAWDLAPFSDDVWIEASTKLQKTICDLWDENENYTIGGLRKNQSPNWHIKNPYGFPYPPFKWNEPRRALLRAELDAYYAGLYGLNRKQLRYILDPADLTQPELEDILDPWEDVDNPLDPSGYDARRAASDFPGETFRVLKEKEIRQFGEYRTRRLVLEAWERLEGVEVGKADEYREKETVSEPVRDVIAITPERIESQPPDLPKTAPQPAVQEQVVEENPVQPSFTDFGLYKCESCGKMVMGFDRESHVREGHGGKSVEWRKVR